MPIIGPALGPVAGGWIAEKVSWRWVFYSTTIADGIVQLLAFVSINPCVSISMRSYAYVGLALRDLCSQNPR